MSIEPGSRRPAIHAVITALTVGGMAVACAMVIVFAGAQSVIA